MGADSRDPSMIGRTFGHYRIESKLGEGGWGLFIRLRTPT